MTNDRNAPIPQRRAPNGRVRETEFEREISVLVRQLAPTLLGVIGDGGEDRRRDR